MTPRRKLRLPAAFIQLPAGGVGLFAVITGGVAWTQRPYSDWTVCLCLLGVLAVFAAAYFLLPVEWLSDDELTDMKRAEEAEAYEKEIEKELAEGTFESKAKWRRYGYIAIPVLYFVVDGPLRSGLDTRSKIPGQSDGLALFGHSFGIWHVFGHDWTGWELIFCVILLVWLGWIVWDGIGLLSRAQKKD